jgi:Cu(I)/Ag(I) efflux system protein CusF
MTKGNPLPKTWNDLLRCTAALLAATSFSAGLVAAQPANADMTDAEVRDVDTGAGTITLMHGEIRNVGMPAMTMVFRVREPALLNTVKAGDKVRFRAEKEGTAIVVTDIRPAN